MPVRCATCNSQFSTIGQVIDHVSDTYHAIQGELSYEGSKPPKSNDPREKKHYSNSDGVDGFAHMKYYDKKGSIIPIQDSVYFGTMFLLAGAKECFECREQFANKYQLNKHILESGHSRVNSPEYNSAIKDMKIFEEMQTKYF